MNRLKIVLYSLVNSSYAEADIDTNRLSLAWA